MNRRNFIKNTVLGICGLAVLSNAANACLFNPTQKVLKKELDEHSLVVIKDGKTSVYDGMGIKPLTNYLKTNNFENAYVGDKRIGKAAALLLVYGKAQNVYTPLISKPAVKVFETYGVKYKADKVVENIINHAGTDICPMEKKTKDINDPKAAYEMLKNI